MIEFELCLCWLSIAGWGEGGDERSGPWFGGNKLRLVEDRCSSSSITHWTRNLGPGASGKSGRCGSSPNAGIWAIKGNRLDMTRQKLHWAVNVCAGIICMYSPGPWTVSWYWTIVFWQDHSGVLLGWEMGSYLWSECRLPESIPLGKGGYGNTECRLRIWSLVWVKGTTVFSLTL